MTDDCPYKAWIERSEELWRKREEMMTHRHEWFAYTKNDGLGHIAYFACGCRDRMQTAEAERRLNATEHLSVISATAACLTARGAGDWVSEKDLLAYARALEGDDA